MSDVSSLQNLNVEAGTRYLRDDNEFGLIGLDHFALPVLDVDLMVRFIHEVLGGEPYYRAGYDELDREMGRAKHVFMRVGNVLMQIATPRDGKLKVGKDDLNAWPHWAFTVTAEDLDRNIERVRSLGIPVFGVVEHRGYGGNVSAYFASPEGHKLELTTYDDYPAEKIIGMTGAGLGPHWDKLFHDWPNSQ